MPSKTYNNQTLAAQERSRRLGIAPESEKSPALAGLRGQLSSDGVDVEALLADAHKGILSANSYAQKSGLKPTYETARGEDFTDPTRTMFQEVGHQAGRVGRAAVIPSMIPGASAFASPVMAGGFGLQGLQQMISPFEAEGESELGGVGNIALAAAPSVVGAGIRRLRGAVSKPLGIATRETAAARTAEFSPRGMPPTRGASNLKRYAAGETPASIVRQGKPGTFITPDRYAEQQVLEGLQRAGHSGKSATVDLTSQLDEMSRLSPLHQAAQRAQDLRTTRRYVSE